MKWAREKYFFSFLCVISLPFVQLVSQNMHVLNFKFVLTLLLLFSIFYGCCLVVYIITSKIVNKEKSFYITVIAFFIFSYFYELYRPFVAYLFEIDIGDWRYLIFLTILVIVFIIIPRYLPKSVFGFFIRFSVILSLSNIVYMFFLFEFKTPHLFSTLYPDNIRFNQKPNVYIIMTDGYGSVKELKKQLNFADNYFYHLLKEKGFTILPDTYSNYPITFLSLLSTLNISYPFLEGKHEYTREDIYEVIGGNNLVFNTFHKNGYNLVHFENGAWDGTNCKNPHAICFKKIPFDQHKHFFLYKIFSYFHLELLNAFFNKTPISFLSNAFNEHTVVTLREINQRIKEEKLPKPFFLFAHLLPPHSPFIFHSDCSIKRQFRSKNLGTTKDKVGYLDNLKCVNRQIGDFINYISANDPEAIVVIFSDHGTDFNTRWAIHPKNWTNEEVEERYQNFIAIKAPDRCKGYLKKIKSNINIFPSIFSCLSSNKQPFLENRIFITTYENHKYGKIFHGKPIE